MSPRPAPRGGSRVALAFFLSGAAALMYQLVWQRLLFTVVGVDIESVTLVVSTFMCGLGLGALLGGWLADAWPRRILPAFCLVEAGIGVFGLFSANLILGLSDLLAGASHATAAALAFALLLLPTLGMGATLPMLVADGFRHSGNVGVSTGSLYFINTVGAALGACAVGLVLLHWLDLRQVTWCAAGLNFAASLSVAAIALDGSCGRRAAHGG